MISKPIHRRNSLIALAAVGMIALATSTANASLLVYEGFQYVDAIGVGDSVPGGNTASTPFHLKGESDGDAGDVDATGLSGVYVDNGPNDSDHWFVYEGSLSFGNLPTSGNRIGFRDNLDSDNHTRDLSAATQTGISNASEIWFSILLKPTDTRSAAAGGIAISDNPLNSGKVINTTTGVQGFGIGSNSSHKFRPYAWDGTSRIDGDAQLNTSTNATYLLVGHISFDSGTDGKDEYTLYSHDLNGGVIDGSALTQIGSTIEADVDQSALDLLNLNRQVKFDADELRIATTLPEALGVPEPASMALLALGGLMIAGRRR
jgi:hypothetical protein